MPGNKALNSKPSNKVAGLTERQPWCDYDEMAGHLYGGMDHQGSTTYNKPDLTQNSRPQQLGASSDLGQELNDFFEKQWARTNLPIPPHLWPSRLNNFDILAEASRRAYLEDGWAFTDCDWRAFLSQTIRGQIKAKEELMVMLAHDLIDFRSNDAPMRTRPAGQEELKDSRSFEKQDWSAASEDKLVLDSFAQNGQVQEELDDFRKVDHSMAAFPNKVLRPSEPSQLVLQSPTTQNSQLGIISQNFTNNFPASGLIPPILTQKSLSKTYKASETLARARPPEQELNDLRSSSLGKQWADANIENVPHPGPWTAQPPEKWAESFHQEELVDSRSFEEQSAVDTINLQIIKCIWTSTTIDQWWYLKPEGLYQGEPPPKNRRLDTSLLRPKKGKRTRIKEDLQGQVSLHGRECCYSYGG
jgi:hypothetical protein